MGFKNSKATGQIGHPKKKYCEICNALKRAAVTRMRTTKALIYVAFPFPLCHTGVLIGKLKS